MLCKVGEGTIAKRMGIDRSSTSHPYTCSVACGPSGAVVEVVSLSNGPQLYLGPLEKRGTRRPALLC